MSLLRSPVSLRRSGRRASIPSQSTNVGIFSRDSDDEEEVAGESVQKECARDGNGSADSVPAVNVISASVSKDTSSRGKQVGHSNSDSKEQTAGRAAVQKLDGNAYKPWGARSRSSSDAGSDTSFCVGGPGRLNCGEPVRSSEYGVSCDKCDKWFHASCQAISKPAYEALTKYKVLAWLCPPCKNGLKNQQPGVPNLTALESKVDKLQRTVADHVKRVDQSLREQEQAVANQTKLMEQSIHDHQTQKGSYADIVKGACSDVLDKVSAKVSSIPQITPNQNATKDLQNVAQIFDDFLDKDKRKNNIVVHNLPEATGNSAKEKIDMDILLFQEMVKESFHLNVAVSKGFRVGRVVLNKARLLIITLDTPGAKHDLLRLAPQLKGTDKWGNIYLTPDLTKAEREAARKLREQLAARRAAGEANITIRKGKIVSTVQSTSTSGSTQRAPLATSGTTPEAQDNEVAIGLSTPTAALAGAGNPPAQSSRAEATEGITSEQKA